MDALLPLANSTGGQAKKMHASELSNVFANTLAVKTVATGVEIAINLHKSLKFRNSDVKLQQNASRMLRKFGAIPEDESFFFEYCSKSVQELHSEGIEVADLQQIPFQIAIQYQRKDGMKCLLTETLLQTVTSDREMAFQQANFPMLIRNAQIRTQFLAKQRRYQEAQAVTILWGQALAQRQVSIEEISSIKGHYNDSAPLSALMIPQIRNGTNLPSDEMMNEAEKLRKKAFRANH